MEKQSPVVHMGEAYSRASGRDTGFITSARRVEKTQAGVGGQQELSETP